jgi:hypothetical protein
VPKVVLDSLLKICEFGRSDVVVKVICVVHCFDFDEDQLVVFFCYDIKFSSTNSEVGMQDTMAVLGVVVGDELLGEFSNFFEIHGFRRKRVNG